VGNITNWTEQADTNAPTMAVLQYDPVNQLLNSTTFSNTVAGAILKQYAYNYDLSGNRTSEQIGTTTNAPVAVSQSFYNNDNQVTNRISNRGPLMFAGSISRQGTVTINGVAALMNRSTTNFVGYATLGTGSNTVPVIATDYGNHSRTNNYGVVVTNNGVAETMLYDANGNMTNVVTATSTNSYQWDAANRLVSIIGPTNQSVFSYNGMGRIFQITEKTNGVAYVTNTFIWDGTELCEQRDRAGGTVTKRFFSGGEQISGTNYYFTIDHLGSIREMIDSTGLIKSRYDYDSYGRRATISETVVADIGYAGMYAHRPSGLLLTPYRQYSADLGRWLSRDLLQESAGLNLYAYVANNPVNAYDPFGLCICDDLRARWKFAASVLEQDGAYLAANGSLPPYFSLGDANSLENSVAGAGFTVRAAFLDSSRNAGSSLPYAVTRIKTSHYATLGGNTLGVIGTGVDAYQLGQAINTGDLKGGISSGAALALDFFSIVPGVGVGASLGLVGESILEAAWTEHYNAIDRANTAQSIAVMQAAVADAETALGNIFNQMLSNDCGF
jgi:RHS repeat-associated protein